MRLARSRWSGLALAAVLSSLAAPAVAHGAAITIEVKLPKPGGVTVKTVTVGFDIGRSSVQAPRALALEVENATDLPDATLAFVSVGKRTEVRGSTRFKVTVVVGRPGGGDEGADSAVRISFVPVEGTGLQAGAVFDGSQGLLEAAVYIPQGKARALLRSLARARFAAQSFFRLAGSASDNAYAKALTFAAADLALPDGATAASPAGVSQRGVIAGRATRSQGSTDAVVWVDGQPALLARPTGAGSCEATDAGDDGVVVGNCEIGDASEAVRWRRSGQSFTVDRVWPGFELARIDAAGEGAGASAAGRAAILMGDRWNEFDVPAPSAATSISDAGGFLSGRADHDAFIVSPPGRVDLVKPPQGFTALAALAVNTVGAAVGVAEVDILNAQPVGRAVVFRTLEPRVLEPLAGDTYEELAAVNDAGWSAGHGVSADGSHGILYGGGLLVDANRLTRTGARTAITSISGVTNSGVIVASGAEGGPLVLAPSAAVEVQNLIAIFSHFDVPDPEFGAVLARLRFDIAYGRTASACSTLRAIGEGVGGTPDLQVFLVPVLDAIADSAGCSSASRLTRLQPG